MNYWKNLCSYSSKTINQQLTFICWKSLKDRFVNDDLAYIWDVHCKTSGNINHTFTGSKLLEMTNYKGNAEELISSVIKDGSAKECFRKMLTMQGVNEKVAQQLMSGRLVLPTAKHKTEFKVPVSGEWYWSSFYFWEQILGLCKILALGLSHQSPLSVLCY